MPIVTPFLFWIVSNFLKSSTETEVLNFEVKCTITKVLKSVCQVMS